MIGRADFEKWLSAQPEAYRDNVALPTGDNSLAVDVVAVALYYLDNPDKATPEDLEQAMRHEKVARDFRASFIN